MDAESLIQTMETPNKGSKQTSFAVLPNKGPGSSLDSKFNLNATKKVATMNDLSDTLKADSPKKQGYQNNAAASFGETLIDEREADNANILRSSAADDEVRKTTANDNFSNKKSVFALSSK